MDAPTIKSASLWYRWYRRPMPSHSPEYSGYYKHCGYKVDVAHDMDDPSLVLEYTTMSINGDEGKCLIPSQQKIASAGMSTVGMED